MGNLLSAGFSRLWRSKVFYLAAGTVFLLAVFIMLNAGHEAAADASGYFYSLEQRYFDVGAFAGIFLAASLSLFIGTDYSDGVIRNRLMVGRTRREIYLASAVLCAAASLAITCAWLAGGLAGVPYLGWWTIGTRGVAMALAVSALAGVSLSALLLLTATISGGKAGAAVACMFLWLALLLAASTMYNALCEPEMYSGAVITVDGLQMLDPTPNPAYVAEPLRSVYTAAVNILPTGQMILLANIADRETIAIANYPLQIAASVLLTAGATAAGLALFKRKDLK